MFHLIVRAPFENYRIGDRITNEHEIERLMDSPFVVRIVAPSDPAPAPVDEQ
jgi:hypothetical protein